MMVQKKTLAFGLMLFLLSISGKAQRSARYCNPLDIDYTYMIYNAYDDISYRSGADPAVIKFRGEYYMFVTRSLGYWHSTDLLKWDFITPEKWYFQGSNAPAAHNYKDSVIYLTGDPSGSMSVLCTDDPKRGNWKAFPGILNDLQDPDLFIDDDGKAYMYWGSSNLFPIRARMLDRNNSFKPIGKPLELFNLNEAKHGWERFGENHADTLEGYIEGPWMTKFKNKYYLQYAAPGTEFNVYGDGVYVSDKPLGPFSYMPNSPFSYKPGGFMNGAGHGSTVVGPNDLYWHFASMAVSVNVNWERRLCMFPTRFDKDGLMYCNTSFGDYPHFAPSVPGKAGDFAGWMLLSFNKPVRASSQLESFSPDKAVDESVKTFWVAAHNNDQQWLEIDLLKPAKVYAVQVNYHDYKSNLYGRVAGLYHQYLIEGSLDGKNWVTLVDRSFNKKDSPNSYEQLKSPETARFIRYRNLHAPTPNLAISGLRVFGIAEGKVPPAVKEFEVERKTDRRDALLKWKNDPAAQGYNVRWGIAPDKLYNSWMVYNINALDIKSLNADQGYYFSIEAFNESGISARTKLIRIK